MATESLRAGYGEGAGGTPAIAVYAICPACGHEPRPGHAFCEACGSDLRGTWNDPLPGTAVLFRRAVRGARLVRMASGGEQAGLIADLPSPEQEEEPVFAAATDRLVCFAEGAKGGAVMDKGRCRTGCGSAGPCPGARTGACGELAGWIGWIGEDGTEHVCGALCRGAPDLSGAPDF